MTAVRLPGRVMAKTSSIPLTTTTAMYNAAKKGDAARVRKLLARGDSPDARSQVHDSPLALAARGGHVAVIEELVRAGADVDRAAGWVRMTPLMRSAEAGHLEAVRMLLELGADPHLRNSRGETCLIHAAKFDVPDVVRFLLAAGAPVNDVSRAGDDFTELERELVEGRTALMSAALGGRIEVAKVLLEAGARTDARDESGQTARDIAAGRGHSAVVGLLDACGSKEEPGAE